YVICNTKDIFLLTCIRFPPPFFSGSSTCQKKTDFLVWKYAFFTFGDTTSLMFNRHVREDISDLRGHSIQRFNNKNKNKKQNYTIRFFCFLN
ncbi:unnamed protein product, partial [Commensalibacter communis]|uniref:hypothetical protein n=1 Tax=Commensalibacter communis TaxID=2972786 RepID=UPI0022FF6F00